MTQLILVSHLVSTFALLGLIWTIQCVHYPAFRYVSSENFPAFHKFHSQQITLIVAPLMLLELFTAAALYFKSSNHSLFSYGFLNFASVGLLWVLTAFVSVPLHNQLAQGLQLDVVNKLIISNWPRTILWTLRALVWAYLFYKWDQDRLSALFN